MSERDLDPRTGLVPGPGAAALLRRLDSTRVLIRTTADSGALALSLANHLVRICPSVAVDAPPIGVNLPVFGMGTLPELAARLLNQARIGRAEGAEGPANLVIGVGDVTAGADLYVSANGWSLRLSVDPHEPLAGRGPAVSAAAALAAAEVFRRLLPELPGVRLARDFEWNLCDYRTRVSEAFPPAAPVDAVCFGAGSVGSSLVLALLLSRAMGDLVVVDDDRLESRNRLKYPAWIGEPGVRAKVDWLQGLALGTSLRVTPYHGSCADWQESGPSAPAMAVAAVDTREGRRQVADVLARETLNAGIEGLAMHVSRNRFGDGLACVYCPYVDTSDRASETDVLRELTGLDSARLLELLGGSKLTAEDVNRMVAGGRLSEADFDLVGGRIGDVARARLYAGARVKTGSGIAEVNAPFVPALAGAILAAEMLKAPGSAAVLDRRVDVDCSGLPTGWTSRPVADPSGRCLCHSQVRRRAYLRAWPKEYPPAGVAEPKGNMKR